MRRLPTPELLAPAGGPDALRAAVANGADAVYLGTRSMNARRGAENFTLESLREAARYAHLRGVRVYLTVNVVVRPDEMGEALDTVDQGWAAGIDGVIVQDLGLLAQVRRHLPHVRLHASTQLDAHNSATIRALADLGVARVTLARETSLEEISRFARAGVVEIESFVHGALCLCHSGRCLMSSAVGGRSANRGLCAQPCRFEYALVGPDGTEATTEGRFLLSTRDLAAVALLPSLVAAGVSALKIEGRMKSPEYVALVTRVYRDALDRALADADAFGVTEREWDVLAEAFSRGFTTAYLGGTSDDRMMSRTRPNDRGVQVGRITRVAGGLATVRLERALESDDTIEVWTSEGRFAQRAGHLEVDGRSASAAPAGTTATLVTERHAAPGDRVFRIANAGLLRAARRTFELAKAARRIPVAFTVRARIGEPLTVTVRAGTAVGRAQGPVAETARTKALTVAEVMEHVGRLGGTPFEAASWEVEIDTGVGAGFSLLHRLRREAVGALEAAMLERWAERAPSRPRPTRLAPRDAIARTEVPVSGKRGGPSRPPELVAVVGDVKTAQACLSAGASRVLVEADASPRLPSMPERLGLRLPRTVRDEELSALVECFTAGRHVAASDLGSLVSAAERGAKAEADWGQNVMNPWSADVIAALGASFVWASPELSGALLREVVNGSPVPVGAVVFGRIELMVADHCVLQAAGPCSRRCASCERRSGIWQLRDTKGYSFPVITDASGRTHIHNAVTLDLSRALAEVVAAGVAGVRLDLQIEPAERAAKIVARFRDALEAVAAGRPGPSEALVTPSTSGHFFRTLR